MMQTLEDLRRIAASKNPSRHDVPYVHAFLVLLDNLGLDEPYDISNELVWPINSPDPAYLCKFSTRMDNNHSIRVRLTIWRKLDQYEARITNVDVGLISENQLAQILAIAKKKEVF